MTDRVYNFSPGPAALPEPVLREIQQDLVSLPGVGASALEVSHRGEWFSGVIAEAERNLRTLLSIPESHRVLFLQGGATMQFSMVPMNLLRGRSSAAYVVTGSWGRKAVAEARKEGEVRVAWSGEPDGFRRVPTPQELERALDDRAAYVHVTSNETIEGVEFPETPVVPGRVPLVADASSDFLSRPIDVPACGVIYAGAQKNAGPAGLTLAIVRDDLLDRAPDDLPVLLDYRTYAGHGSLYNTPPVFSVYVFTLVTRWLLEGGGLEAAHARNAEKAALLYDAIDASDSFYRGHAAPDSRSLMNVTFRLPTEDLERSFVAGAAAQGMIELAGHRSVGGIRASIYNAMPLKGCRKLADYMEDFAAREG